MSASSTPARICPKCGHMRSPDATNPAWQCPACGIAYHKYKAHLQRIKSSVEPRTPQTGPAPPLNDSSIWLLVAANLLILTLAVLGGWQLIDLMIVYWSQSLIIGGFNVMRILSLERFSTENFKINNRPVEPVPETKLKVALFFAVHFGIFHLAYLIFMSSGEFGVLRFGWDLLVGGIAFGINHLFSWRYHIALDRRGTPNIGTLMMLPYARIVPMHMTIIFGAAIPGTGLILFGVLKTAADVVMHYVEHRALSARTT